MTPDPLTPLLNWLADLKSGDPVLLVTRVPHQPTGAHLLLQDAVVQRTSPNFITAQGIKLRRQGDRPPEYGRSADRRHWIRPPAERPEYEQQQAWLQVWWPVHQREGKGSSLVQAWASYPSEVFPAQALTALQQVSATLTELQALETRYSAQVQHLTALLEEATDQWWATP